MAAIRIKTVFLLSCVLFEGSGFSVRGKQRGHVSFHCSHSYAWSNSKYLCRDPCQHDEDRVTTVAPGQTTKSGRFSLQHQGNQLLVNISELQLSDAGLYYCGVERVGLDTFIQVHLTVEEVPEPSTTNPTTPATTATTKLSTFQSGLGSTRFTCDTCTTGLNSTTGEEQFVIQGTVLYSCLGAAALLVLLVTVIYFRKRRSRLKALGQPCLSNSYFVTGHKPAAREQEQHASSFVEPIHLKSLAVSEGPPQPTKGSAANSTRSKHAARQKKKTRQKRATTAERRQPSDIYENFNFHIGGASREDDAANAHDEDDACAIYNNV